MPEHHVLVLVAGTELWVFSRDSYAWEAPVQGHVVESGGEVVREREWALLALSDELYATYDEAERAAASVRKGGW